MQRRPTPARRSPFRRAPFAVWLIFLACLVPEAWLTGADLGLWSDPRARQRAIENFGFWAGLLHGWQPNYSGQVLVMFVSYGFLHANFLHFAVNMFTLFSFGDPIARLCGWARFLLIYAILLLAGAAGFALWPGSFAPMIGASGALFGLVGLILAWDFADRSAASLPIGPTLRNIAQLAILNVIFWWAMNGQLAWQTHLGGFLGGWLLARVFPARR